MFGMKVGKREIRNGLSFFMLAVGGCNFLLLGWMY